MLTYYKLDSRSITCREFRRFEESYRTVLACLLTRLRIPLPNQTAGIPKPAPASESRIEISVLKESLQTIVKSFVSSMTALGFAHPCIHELKDSLVPADQVAVIMLHEGKRIVARLCYGKTAFLEIKPVVFVSWLDTGDFLITSNGKQYLDDPPGQEVVRYTGMEPAELFQHHLEAVRFAALSGKTAHVFRQQTELESLIDVLESNVFQFFLRRSLYREMSQAEVGHAKKRFEQWLRDGKLPPPNNFAWLGGGLVWGLGFWAVVDALRSALNITFGKAETTFRIGLVGGSLAMALAVSYFVSRRRTRPLNVSQKR